ncbi:MAG: formylglycine-generating enzyme family protein [Planctomycetaceae bacterium]|nr:formylglycine-generating enzyme family protein [Planctomycetaceae bacterium]
MGSPADENGRWEDEGPQHEVTISRGFWLGETPVTQRQWEVVAGQNPSRFRDGDESLECPVEQVSWNSCTAYCDQLRQLVVGLDVRLPTEAEWEYACRGGTTGGYHVEGSVCRDPEGLDPVLKELGWFDANSGSRTHAVKQKRANAWGLYDLHGNVWEWCRDGQRHYNTDSEVDPVGSEEANAGRVVRGGSWYGLARNCRAACRRANHPGSDWVVNGLRLFAGHFESGPAGVAAEPPRAEQANSGGLKAFLGGIRSLFETRNQES